MGDDNHSASFGIEVGKKLHHLSGSLRVECSCRFIGQKDLRVGNDASGNGNALLLSARKFVGHVVCPLFEAETFEVFHGDGVALAAGDTLIVERQGHVFEGIFISDEVEGLEDKTNHSVAIVGSFGFTEVLDEYIAEVICSFVVVVEDAENVEQGGFSTARCAHNAHKFAVFDVEVDAFEHVQRLTGIVGLMDVFEMKHRSGGMVIELKCRYCERTAEEKNKNQISSPRGGERENSFPTFMGELVVGDTTARTGIFLQ